MGYIREPEGVNFIVDPKPISLVEKSQISEIISHYKATGEIKKLAHKAKKG